MNNYWPKGLENFSYNCYMNSLLQCLYYCKEFRENLIIRKIKSSNPLLKLLKELFEELKNSNKNILFAKKIKEYLNDYNLFKNEKGGDITDLFDFLFSSISYDNKDEESVKTVRYEEKFYDKNAMLKEITKDIDFNLITNEYFLGFYETEYKCKNDHYKYVFQEEYRMIFPLEEISQYYNKKKSNITIYDCFDYNKKTNNKCSEICPKCHNHFSTTEKIYKFPKLLIIILDRGKNKRYKNTVEFYEKIDLGKYVDEDGKKNCSNLFKLIGVSTHIGSSGLYGHYISFCLCDDNNYYCFNDSRVTKFKVNKMNNIKIEYLYEGCPYVLFYQNITQTTQKKKEKYQIISKDINNYQYENICRSYIDSSNDIKEYIYKSINSIINKYKFEKVSNTYSLIWKKKDDTVTIDIISKNIKISFYKSINKRDKSKSHNNTFTWEVNLNNDINSINDFFSDFEEHFIEFFN